MTSGKGYQHLGKKEHHACGGVQTGAAPRDNLQDRGTDHNHAQQEA
jgi:hypothetical protein